MYVNTVCEKITIQNLYKLVSICFPKNIKNQKLKHRTQNSKGQKHKTVSNATSLECSRRFLLTKKIPEKYKW